MYKLAPFPSRNVKQGLPVCTTDWRLSKANGLSSPVFWPVNGYQQKIQFTPSCWNTCPSARTFFPGDIFSFSLWLPPSPTIIPKIPFNKPQSNTPYIMITGLCWPRFWRCWGILHSLPSKLAPISSPLDLNSNHLWNEPHILAVHGYERNITPVVLQLFLPILVMGQQVKISQLVLSQFFLTT